jgi:dihydrofolate reductase
MGSGADVVGIAAVARNGVIGDGRNIPWHISEDLKRFKRLTMGQVVIMGRRTFDSIGRPLPGRTTFVITRDRMWRGEGVRAVPFVDEAIQLARDLDPEAVFVAGGGEIYRAAWDHLGRLEITEVDLEPAGEVTFPPILAAEWEETGREPHDGFTFVSYRRIARV